MTSSQVLALRPAAANGYRLAWARERLQDSFWPIPAAFLAAGILLAALTVYAPSLGLASEIPAGPKVASGEAAGVLGIIASATLTFLGVVFTLTLVALQLASSQASPRALRTFIRSGLTKVAFGFLLATFAYSVAFLVLAGGHGHEPESRGLTVAVILVTASLLVFLGYVASTMRLLQVAWVITDVADRTRAAIRKHYPPAAAYQPASAASLTSPQTPVALPSRGRRAHPGVLQGVDHYRLVRLAQRHDCVLRLLARIGEYVPSGADLVVAYGGAPDGRDILAGLNLGRSRTLYQDPAYGLRQLVDIAIQALSPAVNQPTTAIQVIDRLADILRRIAASPPLTGYYADAAGRVRLLEPVTSWDDLLDLAFTEITSYGAGSAQVARRLLAAYEAIESRLEPAQAGRTAGPAEGPSAALRGDRHHRRGTAARPAWAGLMDAHGLESLLAVVVVAALAPVVVSALPGPKIPQVVLLILAGVLIGPHGLGLADTTSIKLLSNIGLGFLFLMAGYELDPRLFRERSGRLAMIGWAVSAVLAVGAVGGLAAIHYVHDFVPIGLALTTTALGTLLPILHDNDMLGGKLGRYVLAAGAVGELFPIVAISLFLTKRTQYVAILSLLAVGCAALLLTAAPRMIGDRKLRALIKQGQRATAQTTLRWSIVLLVLLLVAAERFGLDVVLGAMLAGMVLRSWTRRMDVDIRPLEDKLDAVGYGFFIPLFFVASGMTLDIHAIIANPLRLLVFLGLLLVVRGLPSMLVYIRVLPVIQRLEMTFITATTLPLLIALAEIGQQDGVMLPSNAAAMVGAGALSVLIFPMIAAGLRRRSRPASVAGAARRQSAEISGGP